MTFSKRTLFFVLGVGVALVMAALALTVFTQTSAPSDAAAAEEAPAAPQGVLTLDADMVARTGIETARVQEAQYRHAIQGFGQIVGIDTLASADSDLTTAETAVQASRRALTRAQDLFQADIAISRQAVETAQRQATTDEAQLVLAQRRATAAFGLRPPWKTPAERAATLARLGSGREMLVRATFPAAAIDIAPAQLLVRRPDRGAGGEWTAAPVWEAPADPAVPGRSFFALVQGSNLAQGERVLVSAPQGPPIMGVLIPADAIVLSEGQAWCYVATKPGTFARHAVDTGRPMADGYFADKDMRPGEIVVTAGAASLLARERNPSTEAD